MEDNLFTKCRAMPYIRIAAVVWFCLAVFNIIRHLIQAYRCHRLCRQNMPEEDPLVTGEFERIRSEIGLKADIHLFRNHRLESPLVTGYWKKQVILPTNDYDKNQLDVIFYHELTHIKKHDLFFKMCSVFIVAVQCFNPCAYLLIAILNRWSEFDCDTKAVEAMKEECSTKEYFQKIMEMMEMGRPGTERIGQSTVSMLVENKSNLERRIDFMRKYRKTKKVSKVVTGALVMVFALLSTTTSYAAGVKVAEMNDRVYAEMEEVDDETEFGVNQWSEIFEVPASENTDVTDVYVDNQDGVMPIGGGSFDWTIPAGVRYITGQIYLESGDTLSIACTATPNTETYWAGIMLPNGNCKVAEGKGSGNADFSITTSGYYRVMIQNRSSVEIRVCGGYSY